MAEIISFDWLLVRRLGGSSVPSVPPKEEKEQYEWRRRAYRQLLSRLKQEKIADRHTIRHWFGLNGTTRPNRETFFHLAFVLHLTEEEVQEWLTQALLMPGIQINDYTEIIFLYGLENKFSYCQCMRMTELFENQVNWDEGIDEITHTDVLRHMYQEHKEEPPEKFLSWMCENQKMFKGYSKTTWNTFVHCKDEILSLIREEARQYLNRQLMDLLAERERDSRPKEIQRLLQREARRKNSVFTRGQLKGLRELYQLAYGKEKNAHLLSELYASAWSVNEEASKRHLAERRTEIPGFLPLMSDKYLSDILNIGEQKLRYMQLHQMQLRLASLNDGAECPEDIRAFLHGLRRKKILNTVEQAREEIAYQKKHQKYRCRLVQREDLLIFLHCLAQKRYIQSIHDNMEYYHAEDAKEFFCRFADSSLSSCEMAPLNEAYELDALLLSSFDKNDLYSLSDLLEAAKQ